jgi:hypothetical protein
VLYEKYKDGLMKGMNKYRWYEYSASASIMIVIIAMLTGIYDIGTLMLIFFLNVMMILFGLRMEIHNQLTETFLLRLHRRSHSMGGNCHSILWGCPE